LAAYRKAMFTMTKKLLLVDDDPSSISALLAFFITEKFQVRTASDGVGALDVFETWLPDVAILDINMPYRDGYEVARRIRSSQTAEKRTLLVALSGETPPHEISAKCHMAGFDRHIAKPADLQALLYFISHPS
jgi:CheY-like chemotaxis protein